MPLLQMNLQQQAKKSPADAGLFHPSGLARLKQRHH
jgi:hypothetical protein